MSNTYGIKFGGVNVESKTICKIAENDGSKIYAGKDTNSASWLIWEESNGSPVYIGWVDAGEAVTDENVEQSDFTFGETFSREEVLEVMAEFSENVAEFEKLEDLGTTMFEGIEYKLTQEPYIAGDCQSYDNAQRAKQYGEENFSNAWRAGVVNPNMEHLNALWWISTPVYEDDFNYVEPQPWDFHEADEIF